MAKNQAIPTLPGSSRMQMPGSANGTSGIMKQKSGSSKGVSKKMMATAKNKGTKGMNPYGKSC